MKSLFRVAALSMMLWTAGQAVAQAQAQSAVPIAVVDIGEIFKQHPKFNQQVEGLREEVKKYEETLQQQAQSLTQRRELLTQTYKPSDPAYKKEEEQLARAQAQMTTDAQLKRKEFLDEEAKLYFQTYQEVQSLIAQFAQKYNIGLVLRFSRAEMQVEDRASVLQGVYRPVVYYNPRLDITEPILSVITGSATAQKPSAGQPRQR